MNTTMNKNIIDISNSDTSYINMEYILGNDTYIERKISVNNKKINDSEIKNNDIYNNKLFKIK